MLRSRLSRLLFSSWRYSASDDARSCVLRRQQLDAKLCLTEPSGGVEPRRDHKRDVLAVERVLCIQLRYAHQVRKTQRRPLFQADQAVAHEDSIFVHQRHDIGHGPDCRHPNGLQQECAHPIADLLGLAVR